jgi:carbon storage regulator
MLVLTRRVNEKVLLPDVEVAIQVVAVKANQVRLGIAAPENIQIFREELLDGGVPAMASGPLSTDQGLQASIATCRASLDQLRQRLALGRSAGLGASLGQIQAQLHELQREIEQLAIA